MADPVIMCSNERWKSVSRTLHQLGAVLLTAAAIEIYRAEAVSIETGGWLIGAAVLIFAGLKVLILLESES